MGRRILVAVWERGFGAGDLGGKRVSCYHFYLRGPSAFPTVPRMQNYQCESNTNTESGLLGIPSGVPKSD